MFYIKPKRAYCRKHGIEYSGYMCPECRMEMEQGGKDRQSRKQEQSHSHSHSQSGTIPKVKHNAKVPKPKKKEIQIENFPISEEVPEKANQLGNKEPVEKETSPTVHKPKESEAVSKATERQKSSNPAIPPKVPKSPKLPTPPFRIPNWLFALLLIFALSILSLGLNALTKSPIPLWLLLGFSVIYSIEKWFNYFTRKSKALGKLYRLVLNLGILSILGLLIWSGFQLVAKQLAHTPLTGSLVFLAEFVFFVWMWRKVAKNSWRWPSMKLTIFSLICLALVFTFAGVPPLSTYKDNLVTKWEEHQAEQEALQIEQEAETAAEQQRQQAELEAEEAAKAEVKAQEAEAAKQEQLRAEQAEKEAEEEAARIANLRNPSWEELKAFLYNDTTDQLEYIFPIFVCENFARTLQENAKEANWRCAFVSVELSGYPDWFNYGIPSNTSHALNAFETTDRGLIYIDCTNTADKGFYGNADKTVDVEVGKEYIPISIFPITGWESEWLSCGTVTKIDSIKW